MGDPRRRFDRDLSGDPAAERYADDRDVAQIELLEQVEIEIGEVVDPVERSRRLLPAEAGMRRNQEAAVRGEPLQHRRVGLDADSGMQEQQRPSAPALDHLDLDAADRDGAGR
jgi:hypothetical protein